MRERARNERQRKSVCVRASETAQQLCVLRVHVLCVCVCVREAWYLGIHFVLPKRDRARVHFSVQQRKTKDLGNKLDHPLNLLRRNLNK